MEMGGILKARLFSVCKMWPVATPKQMGHLQSSLRPHVLTVVLGPEQYPAVPWWITD